VEDPDEDEALSAEEDRLADAASHREAAALAADSLTGDGAGADAIGAAIAAVAGRGPFTETEARLRALAAEVADLAVEIRTTGEAIAEDPERLDAIRARRQLLHELRRKYGETLAEVLEFQREAEARLAELTQHDRRAAELDRARTEALAREAAIAAEVAAQRRAAAPRLAEAVQAHLGDLAMAKALVEVAVDGPDPADEVTLLLAANPGAPALPLAKVASGGELARTMLALRLVLTAGRPP
jgi:DNA repair protein RecN (Recombination protein N)